MGILPLGLAADGDLNISRFGKFWSVWEFTLYLTRTLEHYEQLFNFFRKQELPLHEHLARLQMTGKGSHLRGILERPRR